MEQILNDLGAFLTQPLGQLVSVCIILLLTIVIVKIMRYVFDRYILSSTLVIHNDPTNYIFLKHMLTATFILLGIAAAIFAVPKLRIFSTSILAGAGILALVVGLAAQASFSNIMSGVFLVIFRPFSVNDRLQIDQVSGIVEDITLRHTVIRSFENKRIVIPNSMISEKMLINSDLVDERQCQHIEILLPFGSDLDQIIPLIQAAAEEHPLTQDQRSQEEIEQETPIVRVKVVRWTELGIVVRAWVWADDSGQAFTITCDVLQVLHKKFLDLGIEFPRPFNGANAQLAEAIPTRSHSYGSTK